MIFTDRTIIVQKGTSSINDTIILYRGDKGVEIRFTLNEGSPFRFGSGASPNIIEKTEAAYGQLIIKRPNDLPAVFSEIAPTNEGKIVFTITAEMIDEIPEVGNYTFQIRLLDESRNSRATLPEVVNGIEIREPIAAEDITNTNEVGVATVGYALTTAGATEDAFDSQGNYNKTTWGTGDRITAAKLNKMEVAIDGVNKKVASGGTVIASKLNGVKIGVLGDSVSAGNYHCYGNENAVVKTWHEFIADKTGAIINNVSRGGSCLTTAKGDNYSFVDRYNDLNSDCKIILIFGGINDYARAENTELGNIGDADTTNICGALKTLCEGLINKYPATPIGFILPYGFNEYKGSGTWKPYENKIIEVLNYYGIPYLNLRTNSIMNANIDFINSKYFLYGSADSVTGDKTHPNTVGHSIIAKPILSFIEDIYYDMYSSDIPSEVLPTSISIRETLSITPGEQSTLAVTFIPSTTTNKYLTWSSNNESVATVSNGVVTGVSKGSCNIIATTPNGKTATCVVTVGNQSTSNYITEGLTNFWNPVGQEQQVTNWVDEIGNKVATISGLDYTQEGFEGNKLKLRAELSDRTDSSSLNVPFEITENCTFEIALKSSTPSNNTYKIADILEIFVSDALGLRITLNGSPNAVFGVGEYGKLTICSIALTKEGSNIKVIVNGVEKIVKTDDTSSGNVNFFSYNSRWKACNDDIYSIKVYNRALNNDELLQNYEYYKTLV